MGKFENLSKYNIFNESLESYYWLGFLFADGTFSRNKNIHLGLAEKDILQLEKFKKFTNSENDIRIFERNTNYGKYKIAGFGISDNLNIKNICKKFNIQGNKTKNPPIIKTVDMTDDQFLSLIIGYIDGDGCIHTMKDGYASLRLQTHVNWLNNLKIIEENIKRITNIPFKSKPHIDGYGYARLNIGFKILKFLKHFSINNNLPILDRKWNLVDIINATKHDKINNIHIIIIPEIKKLRDEHMKFKDIVQLINMKYNLKLSKSSIQRYYYKLLL